MTTLKVLFFFLSPFHHSFLFVLLYLRSPIITLSSFFVLFLHYHFFSLSLLSSSRGTVVVQDFDQDHNDLDKCLVAVRERWSAARTETGAETGTEIAVMAGGKEEEEEQAVLSVDSIEKVIRSEGEGTAACYIFYIVFYHHSPQPTSPIMLRPL
jgi:hypothetical protein